MVTSNARIQVQVPSDAQTRRLVLDPSRSFLVQAPAGSGKTELLMQRYLRLLGHPSIERPESVLAITFTKKAAAEMRTRVLQALESSAGPEPNEPHKKLSHELAAAAAARDRALGWDILQNPSRLQIRTIDSFCDQIARHTPLLSGLGPAPAIAGDFRALYRTAAERTLQMIGDPDPRNAEAMAQVLRDQDNDLRRVTDLLLQLLEKRDQWLRILGRSDTHSSEQLQEVRSQLEASLASAVRHELAAIRDVLGETPADTLNTLFGYTQFAAGNVEPIHVIAPLRDVDRLPAAEPEALRQWRALQHFCLTQKGEFRSTLNNRDGFPPTQRDLRDRCVCFIKDLAGRPEAERMRHALCRLDRIPPAAYSDEQWMSLAALFRVLPMAVAQLRLVFAETSQIDFTEVSQAALAALGDDEHPTDLALSLGYHIQHVLIDEFQDTSVSQFRLLERLVRIWNPASGSTLFVVGDPMQSIYGFRQAEVTLFGEVARTGVAGWALEPQTLTSNFRSVAGLVQWFNKAFPEILTDNDATTGAVKYVPATASKAGDEVAVSWHGVAPKDYLAEARKVRSVVEGELARDGGTVALLVRSRTHLKNIVAELREAGIPFRAREIDLLGERQTVRDLYAITRAVLYPADRVAWLALLRSPCCGLELNDLWTLCRGDRTSTVWELLQERAGALSPRAQGVVRRILPVLESSFTQRGRRTLRSLVESLWISLGGHASLPLQEREACERDAASYLDLLERLEKAGTVDESQLVNGLETLYAPPDTRDGIRLEVMTIHASKGLEFDTVILPGLNRTTDHNKKQLLNWRERILDGRDGLLLAPLEPVGAPKKSATVAGYIQALAADCTFEEGKRLLYVAATRARHRLHLVSTLPEPEKTPARGSFLSYLWHAREFAPLEALAEAEPRRRVPQVLRRLPVEWTTARPEPVLRDLPQPGPSAVAEVPEHTFEWVQENMRRVGTVTHRMLQQIGREGLERWTVERVAASAAVIRGLLVQEGVPASQLSQTVPQVLEALDRTIQDRHGRWILSPHAEARNEFELSAVVDGSLLRRKLDRTFVDGDGIRWIVDYKTTTLQGGSPARYLDEQVEKYTPDLKLYAHILRQYDARPIRAGLYFPLMAEWREVRVSEDDPCS